MTKMTEKEIRAAVEVHVKEMASFGIPMENLVEYIERKDPKLAEAAFNLYAGSQEPKSEVPVSVTKEFTDRGRANVGTTILVVENAATNGTTEEKSWAKMIKERFNNDYDKITEYLRENLKKQGVEMTASGILKESAYFTGDALRYSSTGLKEALYWLGDRIEDGGHWAADMIEKPAGPRPTDRQFNRIENAVDDFMASFKRKKQ